MLESLQNEVRELHAKILAECGKTAALKELYKGCQIYYNKLYPRQDVMLLGINPGSGFRKKNNKIVEIFEPLVDENFDLAAEVKSVFEKPGKTGLYEKSFRTNCYFFATDSENKLRQLINLLPGELRTELDAESRRWVKTLIAGISPKIIICEGFSAYRRLLSIFYPHSGRENIEDGEYTKIAKIENRIVLAFKRMYCYFYSTESKTDFTGKLNKYIATL
jgi:hypothetical protein